MSTRLTSDSQRAVSATCSITSLHHTSSNELSSSGSGPSIGASRNSSSGCFFRARSDRRPRDLDADRLCARSRQLRCERPVAATQIEHPLAGPRLGQQQVPAESVVGRIELVRQPLPQFLVVFLHTSTLTRATSDGRRD